MVEDERKVAVSATLATSACFTDPSASDRSVWPRRPPRRSRFCSFPAHGFGACSRQRPARTATFGQFGWPQTLAARLTLYIFGG
jgi:hypothetical protein